MEVVEQNILDDILASASLAEIARIKSCSHPRANYYLAPPPRFHVECWLPPAEFDLTLRLRLGLVTGSAGSFCNRCHSQVPLDESGEHELACMCGPERIELHTELTNVGLTFATRGGLQPCRESRPFPDDAQARLDISFIHANQSHLLDFAVTSHLRSCHLTAAAETPGGAATSYEVVKRNRYLSHVRPGQVLHPVVFDTLGAWGASADRPLYIIASAYARRSGLGPSAVHLFYAHLNSTLVKGVARLLLCTSMAGSAAPVG
jgi:hypothetical protein